MSDICITKNGGNEFTVAVESSTTTQHEVTLTDETFERLGGESKEDLIRRSFEFLLEREPNTSILREFDLPVISNYFSEYDDEIRG